jgi:erythronate-4-phosphate dehydrogenase
MRVLADENIPFAKEAFREFGEVRTYKGRELTPARAAEADLLLVRSVTRVGPELLDGSHVRFVATATIGTDHVDTAYLEKRGIRFASAPGSNANSVSEYLAAALLEMRGEGLLDRPLSDLTLGIIGVGNVGSRVEQKAEALAMKVLLNDPPLQRRTHDPKYLPLERLFEADIITLHVPLTKHGPDTTQHLADEQFFASMRKGTIFFNTSRGPVVESGALLAALNAGQIKAAVVDVWEGEPHVDAPLLERVFIGTPHIAGYSYDGKVNGTRMIYEAACAAFGRKATWSPKAESLPVPKRATIHASGRSEPLDAASRAVVKIAYDVRADDAGLRKLLELPVDQRAAHFDKLRQEYPIRREWFATTVKAEDPPLRARLGALGFQIHD